VHEVEQRNHLKFILPWLETRVPIWKPGLRSLQCHGQDLY
jgi:hypothetical protein